VAYEQCKKPQCSCCYCFTNIQAALAAAVAVAVADAAEAAPPAEDIPLIVCYIKDVSGPQEPHNCQTLIPHP